MEEIFRYPLSTAGNINRRATIIRHLANTGTRFPFEGADFDAAEQYLANTDERSRLSVEDDTLAQRLGQLITVDAEMNVIQKGIPAILHILGQLRDFISSSECANEAFNQYLQTLTVPLLDPNIKALLVENHKAKLSYAKMVAYDGLLRFKYRTLVRHLLQQLYELDALVAAARVATDKGFVLPVALADANTAFRAEGLFHPLLSNPVANDIGMASDRNLLFLTGANMAGKSTFMKSLGIAFLLAHMGFPVPALRFEFSVLDGLFTTINLPDNLIQGASHYYAEVLRVKKVATELRLGKRLFVIFDELFRGTNVKDAYEATIVLTEAFARKTTGLFVISTHIIEAGDVLRERCPTIAFAYLPTRMNGHEPVYTYKLDTGITADRHGMVIVRNEGILDILSSGLTKNSHP